MKFMKRVQTAGLAGVMALTVPFAAAAASPEFSRSAEEWARLQDNVLEYEEITDLIHEYNATVKKNQIDLDSFRKDYGMTNTEWADKYRDVADNVESNMSYPDSEDSGYASMMLSNITNEMTLRSLRQNADDALQDYQVTYYTYCGTEARLASAAQSNMITYYLNQLKLEKDEKQLAYLQESYQNTLTKKSLGSATDVEVLLAGEGLRNAEKTIQDDKDAIESVRQSLIISMGWSHDAQPEIREIPVLNEARIFEMNPDTDKAAAIENSYSMKANRRKLENARNTDKIETLERTIRESEQSIGASLVSSYQSVLASKAAYDLAVSQSALEQKNLQASERQYQLGAVSRMAYVNQKNTAENAELAVETARLNLFKAIQDYDWQLNGLAGN